MEKMKTWDEFYASRVNYDFYESYFRKRYKVFLDYILSFGARVVKEEGIGIGSVYKQLIKSTPFVEYVGSDVSEKMLNLCKINNKNNLEHIDLLQEDMINYIPPFAEEYDLLITHGVLEHFSDKQIQEIWYRQNCMSDAVIAYVPTNKYLKPSFGDERLMSVDKWVELLKPDDYVTFNNGYDLLLVGIRDDEVIHPPLKIV